MSDLHERLSSALSERYELDREIGRGGMAVVYLATDLKQGRQVALKVFQPDIAAAMGPARFQREVEIATRLEHPHILSLYDSGEAEGLLYYVMPYVKEESLRHRLDREGQLPIEDALRIAREMAEALDYAHDQGVVHRDVKPGNVLLQRGHALLADFGVARALEASGGEKLTGTGMSVGTPQYMAPEQATGAEGADGRADVYAVGAVLYEMLTGESPYTGSTAQAVLARRMAGPPTPIPVLRETVPPELDAVVQKAMARSAADRWQSAGDLAKALAAAERGGTPIPGLSTWPGVTGEVAAVGAEPKRGRRWAAIGVAAAAVAVLALAGNWYSGREASEDIAADLPELDPMLVLVVPERPSVVTEWQWTGILISRIKNLGDLEVVVRRDVAAVLADTPILSTSAADSFAATRGAGKLVLVSASEIGDEIRLNLSLYATGDPKTLLAEVDTTVSQSGQELWAPDVVVRLFNNQEIGLASQANTADLNSGLAKPLAEIWASKGLAYWTRGQYDSAAISYRRAVEIDSMYVEAWGQLIYAAGFSLPFDLPADHDSVIAHHELVEYAGERFRALGGQPDKVKPTLDEARRLAAANPRSAQAQYGLYEAIRPEYWKYGSPPDSAIAPLLASIELDPHASYNRFALIVYYLCVGDAERLRRTYEEAKAAGIPNIPVDPVWPALAGLALGSETVRDSILAQLTPSSFTAAVATHRLPLLQDDMDLVVRVATVGVDERAAHYWRFTAALAGGRWAEAARVIPLAPNPGGWLHGSLYKDLSALAGAGVLELSPDETRALRDSVLMLVPPDSMTRGDITIVERPHVLGLMSAQLGDSAAAHAFADSLEELGRGVDELRLHRWTRHEIADMVADLALEVRALVLRLDDRPEEALAMLERQTFSSTDGKDQWWATGRTYGRFMRAEILSELGRFDEAAGWYATIPRVKMYPHQDVLLHAPVFRGRAKALDALGRSEDALHYYRRFVTRWQDADPHLQPQVEEARQRIRELEAELN